MFSLRKYAYTQLSSSHHPILLISYVHLHVRKHMLFRYCAVGGDRFAELNICGFSAIKVFTEILLYCLGHKCSLFSTIKKGAYIHGKLHGTPENREKHKSLAQRIFPCLRYVNLRGSIPILRVSFDGQNSCSKCSPSLFMIKILLPVHFNKFYMCLCIFSCSLSSSYCALTIPCMHV